MSERKRARVSNPSNESALDEAHPTDDERVPDETTRPGQVERKRELERNRRNLVNVRFAELEAELRRTAPRVDLDPHHVDALPARPPKGKRIDKEAVLKDAAHRLVTQRKELASAADRMASMLSEMENLRSEKVELRSEKAYLRSELETVRGEMQQLRSDNINLWQAFRKASSIKSSFAPDVAKLPAELFFRPKQTVPPQQSSNQGTIHPLLSDPSKSQPSTTPTSQPTTSMAPPASQTPSHFTLQQMLLVQQQQEEEQRRQLQSISNAVQNSNANLNQNITLPTDSFLMLQSASELGELFANYAPREPTTEELGSQPAPPPRENISAAAPSPSIDPVADTLFPAASSPCANMPQLGIINQTLFSTDPQSVDKGLDLQKDPTASTRTLHDSPSATVPKSEASKDGTDIAYCV